MSRRKVKHFKNFTEIIKVKEDESAATSHWKDEQDKLVISHIIKPRTKNQERFINAILTNVITIAEGPPGVGKTAIACGMAAKLLVEGKIDKIILTRPQVEVGGVTQGYLPGSHVDKLVPYIAPMIDELKEFLGGKSVDNLIKREIINIVPLGLIRGKSPKGTFIIADESQSMRYIEFKTLLTRIDLNSRLVLLADPSQSDLITGSRDFDTVCNKLYTLKDEIGFIKLDSSDCQRAGIVRKIIELL